MYFMPRRRWNIILLYSTLDRLPLHILQAKWAMFSVVGRAVRPTAARNPSSAGMPYHLSKYLDNWIWEGSRSRHCNQWHCQRCHWEPASSCAIRSQVEGGREGLKSVYFQRADWMREVIKAATFKKRWLGGGSGSIPSNDAPKCLKCSLLPKEWTAFLWLLNPVGIKWKIVQIAPFVQHQMYYWNKPW